MHYVIAQSEIFIGDSQTMAAESAVLGTPFLRINNFVGKIGYLNEMETNYELGYGFKPDDQKEILNKIKFLLKLKNKSEIWTEKVNEMYVEKINVINFFIWFIENYPESFKTMKQNPDYQYRFK